MDTRKVCSLEEEKYYKEMFGRMRKMKDLYTYEGSVYELDRNVRSHWKAATYAVSSEKARSNLMFQYKKEHGLPINTKIDLPGVLMIG